ncbi:hypothetical protein AB9P05_24345 [Roseivirga sp. BDSF3-8]|uniref:hypothetical protein n=1 Tax=Roseivirga sp. BDSF3-8 TaxID=3241598 RepID=UPI003531E8DC
MEYYPERFLTEELIHSALLENNMVDLSNLEDDLPDGIIIEFPNGYLYFSEYGEGDITCFVSKNLSSIDEVTLPSLINSIHPQTVLSDEYPVKMNIPFASKEKVTNQIKNYLFIANKFILSYLIGDESWPSLVK